MNENNIIAALNTYDGSQNSLEQTVAVLAQELGPDWTTLVFQQLGGLSADLKEKLNHVFNYYASLTAWQEAQSYLESTEPLPEDVAQDRLPVLKHWLDFFGEPGQELYQKLENKLNQGETQENIAVDKVSETDEQIPENKQTSDESAPVVENVVQANPTSDAPETQAKVEEQNEEDNSEEAFVVKKAVKEITLLENLQSWLSARCLELGDIEVFAYPYYGMMVDLMRQAVKAIQAVEDLQTPVDVARFYNGGLEALQRKKQAIEADIQTAVENCESDTTALIDKNVNLEDVKKTLGALDETSENEYIGPAPDGFELMEEETPLDEKAVKEQYQQLEEQVKEKIENEVESEKKTSQNVQNGVQRKLSFSLKPKKS